MERRYILDCDNALGSASGDVDDAFAIAYAFAQGLAVTLMTSVGGNASAAEGFENTRALLDRMGAKGCR